MTHTTETPPRLYRYTFKVSLSITGIRGRGMRESIRRKYVYQKDETHTADGTGYSDAKKRLIEELNLTVPGLNSVRIYSSDEGVRIR